jgi:hypothetical protein
MIPARRFRTEFRRLRHSCRFLHSFVPAGSDRAEQRENRLSSCQNGGHAGHALLEVLISLSILVIGVLGMLFGSRGVRQQADLASRLTAEALAAQQVLERKVMWESGESTLVDTVSVGSRSVSVIVRVRDTVPGIAWLLVSSDAGSGRTPWRLETARRYAD